jgi:hypothetical protein
MRSGRRVVPRDTVGFTQLRLKKIINSPPPTINNFNRGNGRFGLPEYIAVLRIQISRAVDPGNQKQIFSENNWPLWWSKIKTYLVM